MRRLESVATAVLSMVIIGAAPAVAETQESASLAGRIGGLLQSYHELEQFDGAALVARDGVVLLDRGYGLASREFAVPNGGDIRYRLASISKTFTAVLAMQLVAEGRLSLEATLADVLPGYRADTGSKVLVRHLLGHTSGIPDYFRVAGGWAAFAARMGTGAPSKPEFAAELCSGDLEFDPGTRWSYSNCGYFLLGMIIERITGEPYDRVLRTRILDPAGMDDSGDEGADPLAVVARMASSYIRTPDGVHRQDYWNMASAFAAGSLYATPRDLLRYDRALADETLLPTGAKEQMFSPGVGGYGLGWEVREAPIGPDGAVRRVATHEGFLFGSHTRIYRVLDDGLLVVLLSNAGDAPLEGMAAGIFDVLYGRQPVAPRPSIAKELRRVLREEDAGRAAERYRELRRTQPEGWNFAERELNVLGYELLRSGRLEEAVVVFRLNLEAFPGSGNCHDSLGEALAAQGRTEEAIREYTLALELDPTNRNAEERLKLLADALEGRDR